VEKYGTGPHVTVKYGTGPQVTVKYGTGPHVTVKYGTAPHVTVKYGTAPHVTVKYGAEKIRFSSRITKARIQIQIIFKTHCLPTATTATRTRHNVTLPVPLSVLTQNKLL
jgi:hypothetical protein